MNNIFEAIQIKGKLVAKELSTGRIASKGEIRDMLTANDDITGIVIQLQDDNKPSVKELMEAMETLMKQIIKIIAE